MTDKKDEALKLALEALEKIAAYRPLTFAECSDAEAVMGIAENAIPSIREALAEQPAQLDPSAGTQVSKVWWDGDKLITQPIPLEKFYKEPEQPAQQQEPVAHSIVAGALFDFMGWLTSRRERLALCSTDDAAPAADAIKDFAHMRSLSINDAKVQEWQKHLAAPQPSKPLDAVDGDVLPPIGSRVFIRHGRDNAAHACTVTGYYAWPAHGGDKNVHRVFVRMVYEDTETQQARLLCDCYPTEEAAHGITGESK